MTAKGLTVMVTIRIHDVRVVVRGENPGPHLQAIGYRPDSQELTRGTIYAGHSPSVRADAIAEVSDWLRKHRPGRDIETLPDKDVISHG